MALSQETALEIQDLTWSLADDTISPEETRRLETLLLEDAEARKLYVQCMQLQADLHLFFNPRTAIVPEKTFTATPVLKNLPNGGTSTGTSASCASDF